MNFLRLFDISRSKHFFLCAACVTSMLALGTPAWSQGRQMMVIDEGDGQMVMQFSLPNFDTLKDPDFVRQDLVTINKILNLQAEQRFSVQGYLRDYLEAFNKLLRESLPKGPESGNVFAGGGPDNHQDGPADFGGGGIGSIIHDTLDGVEGISGLNVNIDGSGAVNIQIQAGKPSKEGKSRKRQQTRQVMVIDEGEGGPDERLAQEPGVTVSVNTPEGVTVPEDVLNNIKAKAKELADKLEAKIEEDGGIELPMMDGDPIAAMEARQQYHDELTQLIEQFKVKKENLKAEFVTTVQNDLTDTQLQRWPNLERTLTRQKTLPKGRLQGEQTDLIAVLENLKPGKEQLAAIAETLEAYETTLHSKLIRRNNFIADANQKVDDAIRSGKLDKALKIIDKATALRVAVRDTNQSFTETISQQLNENFAAKFHAAALKASYPDIYRTTIAQKAFTKAAKLSDLDQATQSAITDLHGAYLVDLKSANEKARRVVLKHEPDRARKMIESIKAMMEGGLPGTMQLGGGDDDPIKQAMDKRTKFDDRFMKQLYDMLTPAQIASLPKRPSQIPARSTVIQGSLGRDGH